MRILTKSSLRHRRDVPLVTRIAALASFAVCNLAIASLLIAGPSPDDRPEEGANATELPRGQAPTTRVATANWSTRELIGHRTNVISLAVSPDGQRLASVAARFGEVPGEVKVWDVNREKVLHTLDLQTLDATSLQFLPDGKRLLLLGTEGPRAITVVKLWESANDTKLIPLTTLDQPAAFRKTVALSPDGTQLAVARQQSLSILNIDTGKPKVTWTTTGRIDSMAFSQDGTRLATAGIKGNSKYPGVVQVWNVASGEGPLTLQGHAGWGATCVEFSPNGKLLLSASRESAKLPGDMKVWDASSGKLELTLTGHTHRVLSGAFVADGKHVFSLGSDANQNPRELKLWDATTGREICTLSGHIGNITGVAISPDGKWLASTAAGGLANDPDKVWTRRSVGSLFTPLGNENAAPPELKLWDARSGKEMLTWKVLYGDISGFTFFPDSQCLAVTVGRHVRVLRLANATPSLSLQGHSRDVLSVAFSPDGKQLASASKDGTIKIWDAISGREIRTLKGHSHFVSSVAYSPDGKRLASASWDQTVKLWDPASGLQILTIHAHTDTSSSVCTNAIFSPDGKQLLSMGSIVSPLHKSTPATLWDAASGKELLKLNNDESDIASAVFRADGRQLTTVDQLGGVRTWDCTSGRSTIRPVSQTGLVSAAAISPEAKQVSIASIDLTDLSKRYLRTWNLTTGEVSQLLNEQGSAIKSLSFKNDNKHLAVGNADGTLQVLDVTKKQEVRKFTAHYSLIHCVTFSPDGKRLASASADNTVKIWDTTNWP